MVAHGDPPLGSVTFGPYPLPGVPPMRCPNAPGPCHCAGACRRTPQEQFDHERFRRLLETIPPNLPPKSPRPLRPEDV